MRYIIAVAILLFIWVFAGSFVTEIKNHAAYGFNQVLLWPRWWIKGLVGPALTYKEQQVLILENEKLKAEVFRLSQKQDFPAVKIHSRYPFNNKSILSVDAGVRDGIKIGAPVTVGGSIFIGKVEKVFERYSLVKTIFSGDFQLPVRIGIKNVEALLKGGSDPKVQMVVNDEEIEGGQVVFTAGRDLPYGLKVGEVGEIRKDVAAAVFREATVNVPYNFNELTEVIILKEW